jgi:integration host factor subunit beta
MNRSDLIDLVHVRFPSLTHDDATTAVTVVLEAITETLASGDRVEVRGFGTFALNYRPPRTGRNPRTGEKVAVPEKYVPHFKAGKGLRDGVDLRC